MKLFFSCLLAFALFAIPAFGQTSDTPLNAYQWKRNSTEPEAGYVVLRSGKRLEGRISLERSGSGDIETIVYSGEGQEIDFPPQALQSYGLNRQVSEAPAGGNSGGPPSPAEQAAAGPMNESPEELYTWKYMGMVMEKEIHVTERIEGYVVLLDGTRYEGQLKLKKRDGVLITWEVRSESGKEKGDIEELRAYGISLSEQQVTAQRILAEADSWYPATVSSGAGTRSGQAAWPEVGSHDHPKKLFFRSESGEYEELSPESIDRVLMSVEGPELAFFSHQQQLWVREDFRGETFLFYHNPNPTNVNQKATDLAKKAFTAGLSAAASQLVKASERARDYETDLDDKMSGMTDEELRQFQQGLAELAGYNSIQEARDNGPEELTSIIAAVDLELLSREAANSEEVIYFNEWKLVNLESGEEVVTWRGQYAEQMEPLLLGCYEYITLGDAEKKELLKWRGRVEAVKLLDGCY